MKTNEEVEKEFIEIMFRTKGTGNCNGWTCSSNCPIWKVKTRPCDNEVAYEAAKYLLNTVLEFPLPFIEKII